MKIVVSFEEDLKCLYNKIESKWYSVASGQMTEEEINDLLYTFKSEYTSIENKNLKEEILLEKSKLQKRADTKTEVYFANNF